MSAWEIVQAGWTNFYAPVWCCGSDAREIARRSGGRAVLLVVLILGLYHCRKIISRGSLWASPNTFEPHDRRRHVFRTEALMGITPRSWPRDRAGLSGLCGVLIATGAVQVLY